MMAILYVKQIRKQDKTHNDNIIKKLLILYGNFLWAVTLSLFQNTTCASQSSQSTTQRYEHIDFFFINQHVYIMDTLSQ